MVLCGHRFDVRALLIHFMRNTMTCPLCRAGVGSTILSCQSSFPEEAWMCEAETRIQSEKEKEENRRQQEDGILAGRLQSMYYHVTLPSMLLSTLHEQTVNASLFFYDMPVPALNAETNYYPIHGMQFELELLPLEPHHRDLSRGISLYSSFSSNSLATPPPESRRTYSPPSADDILNNNNNHNNHNEGRNEEDATIMIDRNNDYTNADGRDRDYPNPSSFIPLIIPYSGSVSLEDISVHYAMSESTLRYNYY